MIKHNVRTIWKIYPPFLLIIVLSTLAVGLYAYTSVSNYETEKTIEVLQSRAKIIAYKLSDKIDIAHTKDIDQLCKILGKESNSRITIILANGNVIGDSLEDPFRMENHKERTEIEQARKSGFGIDERVSATLGEMHLYVAVSVKNEAGEVIGFIRNSRLIDEMNNELGWLHLNIILGVLFAALIAAIASVFVTRGITKPLLVLENGAKKFANQELDFRITEEGSREISELASTLNYMASHLSSRILEIEEQRNETESILASLHEGVLAFDSKRQLIKLNDSACEFLDIESEFGLGKSILDISRNTSLHEVVDELFKTGEITQRDISFRNLKFAHVLVGGSILKDVLGKSIGALIVLNNVTNLRKLETLRKDFVANVSHELKTPITSIKGFCENLLDGALEDPEVARKFVGIVASQTNRLNAIINDLLSLSQLEKLSSVNEIEFSSQCLAPIIRTAVENYSQLASEKEISLDIYLNDELQGNVNSNLLEEAISNLLDNAIKYSENEKSITVELSRKGQDTVITVSDHGIGISQEHLERVFERFYRVDKARTRKLGGTGLGLAIVKHISLVHGGRVAVESSLGVGSQFSIILPSA